MSVKPMGIGSRPVVLRWETIEGGKRKRVERGGGKRLRTLEADA